MRGEKPYLLRRVFGAEDEAAALDDPSLLSPSAAAAAVPSAAVPSAAVASSASAFLFTIKDLIFQFLQ